MRWLLLVLALLATPLAAQEFSALARLDPEASALRDEGRGIEVDLWLSQPVPWRVFTLDAPRRLVMDFREIDWRGVAPERFLQSDLVRDLRFGPLRPGWSRLVADLAAPLRIAKAGMEVDEVQGTARLRLTMHPSSAADFTAAAGAPPDPGWDALAALDVTRPPAAPADDGVLRVAIDPGHGGIDPGATRDGVREADLMLALARDLAAAIARTDGLEAVLTREADVFVPLQTRMSRARAAGADVFVSLHADALAMGHAAGASVYRLNAEGQGAASARMAERHGRGDLLAGLDLSGQDDTVAKILLDLARAQTGPQSARLQSALIAGFARAGARLNSRPAREGRLAVLMSSDFPSVLIEAGFLSNDADRAALQNAEGRAPLVAGIVLGLRDWAQEEAALAPLMRQ